MSVRLAALLALAWIALTGCVGTSDGKDDFPQNPHEAAVYNAQLGMAYLKKGELEFAREKIDRALKQDPQSADVHRAAALLYDRVGEANKAERHYDNAMRLKPNDPLILNNYGVFLCRHGKLEKGEQVFQQSAKSPFNREPENAYSNAGTCLRDAKRYEEAAAYFDKALAIRPRHRDALFQLAEMDFDRRRFEESRVRVLRYMEAAGATAEILWLGVRVERALGNITAANAYARRLKTEFPTAEQTRALIASERKS